MGKASHKKKRRRNDSPTVAPLSGSLIKLAHSVCENPKSFSFEQMKTLISIAAMAWNLSLFPKESRAQQAQALMTGPIDGEGGSLLRRLRDEMVAKKNDKEVLPTMAMLDLISIMLRKKDELYPGDKRLIVNYKITSVGSGEYNVTVASADTEIN